ncbi:MAG TPA: 2'-5' RNA ligase family protein [Casimicrobiaceae bacterium]|jgi:hypothetical protein|nr:2'-5' RNA ligase family protein [Casimicrobiaceae bacterium]
MPTLYTVSYPDVSPQASAFMQAFRQEHDLPYRDVVDAHFTMVFGSKTIDLPQYTQHVATIAAKSRPVSFSCRYAMLGKDDFDDSAYVFLVPDEGYSAISLLHDGLYTGPLMPLLRLDIPFIPHITIGTLKDRAAAKALCDELNREGLRVEGTLRALTIGALEDGKLKSLSSHAFSEIQPLSHG